MARSGEREKWREAAGGNGEERRSRGKSLSLNFNEEKAYGMSALAVNK